MRAQLHSLSIECDPLGEYKAADPTYFGALLSATIGPEDGPGEEIFQATVCSPAWLADHVLGKTDKGFVFLRHYLVVARWDADRVEMLVSDLCSRASGRTWSEVAGKLSRYLAWEYEDYMPA